MTIRDRKALKETAAQRLSTASFGPRRLILIHSGVTLAMALLLAVCNYIVTWQINLNGGGLSGIQLRSILETVYNTLSVLWSIVSPFWALGIVYAALRLIRGKSAWPHTLLEGFRRGRSVIRFLLIQILIYGLLTLVAIYGAWILYIMFFPAGQAFAEGLWELINSGVDYTQLMENIPEEVMIQVTKGYMPLFGIILAALVIPTLYRLRLARYLVMEEDALTPWKAIRTSGKVMRRKGFSMLALDLSFWWYYLIQVILMLPAYVGVLENLGITLPIDSAVLYLGGNALYAVLTLAFECAVAPKVITTYALAYEALMEEYQAANPPAQEAQ